MQVIDNIILKLAIWVLRRGYGADCPTRDTDDMPELKMYPIARCASCEAAECIDFLQNTIDL